MAAAWVWAADFLAFLFGTEAAGARAVGSTSVGARAAAALRVGVCSLLLRHAGVG